MKEKTVRESAVTMGLLMQPDQANMHGNVHGGHIMKLIDEAGAAVATLHAERPVVTVAVDQVIFREPIHVGDLVSLRAKLTYVGRTSLETRVDVTARNLITGACTETNTAYFVYVALESGDRPAEVPRLRLETDEDRREYEAARERQAYRLSQRQKERESKAHSESAGCGCAENPGG
jgi:acyl-CoA hydrolase